MANVIFKYGKFTDLKDLVANPPVEGTISVTTDTHSMFVDLGGERFRLSDFETYENLKDLVDNQKNWVAGSLAIIKETSNANGANNVPILAYYDGNKWTNINDTGALETTLRGLIAELDGKISANTTNISSNAAAIAANTANISKNATDIGTNATNITNIKQEIGTKKDSTNTKTIWEAIEEIAGGSGDSLATLKAAIEQEAKDRAAADTALSTTIGEKLTEAKNYTDAEVLKEANRAKGEESRIEGLVGTEKTRAEGKEAELAKAIEDEAKERAAQDTALSQLITNEANRAKGEESRIEGLVGTEKTRAEGKEAELEQLITDLEAVVAYITENDVEGMDSIKELVTWVNTHGSEANAMLQSITALQAKVDTEGTVSAAIAAEKTRAENAEAGLQGQIDTITSTYATKQELANEKAALQSQISAVDAKFNWTPFKVSSSGATTN